MDNLCATVDGETVVDDKYCCCIDWTDPDKFVVVEPCCGGDCYSKKSNVIWFNFHQFYFLGEKFEIKICDLPVARKLYLLS